MRGQKITFTIFTWIVLLCAGLVFCPASTYAQYGMGMGMGGGMGGGMGMGMYGMGGMGMGMGGSGQPNIATVKYGKKIFDAVFGDLIEYKVYYIQVRADSVGEHYFDDGVTAGDEVAFDGMPSLIYIDKDTYLGPFSIKYKQQLEKMLEKAKEMGPLLFYNLNVASTDPESRVDSLSARKEQMETEVLDFMRQQLAQFEGYDDEKYYKAVDPALFESLEGFGGGFDAGFGAGGYIPDMPTPPGLPQPQDQFDQPSDELDEVDSGGSDSTPLGNANNRIDSLSGLGAQEAMNELP